MLGVGDVSAAGKLIAFLSVFASTLPIALSCDGGIATTRPADAPGSEDHVDSAQHILHTVAVMFDTARVQQETRLRRAPPLGRLANDAFGDTRNLRRAPRSPGANMLGQLVETDRMLGDEILIEPVVLDHQMQYAVEKRTVATRLDGQEEIASASQRRETRINDDDPRSLLAGLP